MRSTPSFLVTTGLLALALVAAPAAAQVTGRLSGQVVDARGEPLTGVAIELSGPDLQGIRSEVSDARGRFRFLALPPSEDYTLTARLDGFNSVRRENLRVSLDREVQLELELSPAFADEIVVHSDAPLVDRASTTIGAAFSEELFSDLPLSRDYTGMAFAAPGVVSGGLVLNRQEHVSIAGASAAENRYIVNGLDTTDPAFGTIGAELPLEFVQEVEIKTGGYEAEYGGALGGVLNVVTKSGSNDLHGDLFGFYSDDSLQEKAPPTETAGQDLGFTEYDFGVDLGGRIVRDRLWYFAALNPNHTVDTYTSLGGTVYDETDDTLTWAGKLTLQANPSHQLYLSLFGYDEQVDDIGLRSSIGRTANTSDDRLLNAILGYNAALSSSFFLEASAGRYDLDDRDPTRSESPRYFDATIDRSWAQAVGCEGIVNALESSQRPTFNGNCDGSYWDWHGPRSRDQLKAIASLFARTGRIDHELKAGAEWRDVEYTDDFRNPGRISTQLFDETGLPIPRAENGWRGQAITFFDGSYRVIHLQQDSTGTTRETALFAQDQLRIGDHFTLSLGLRADDMRIEGERSASDPEKAIDFGFGDTLAPRVGFTWDVARNGKSKLYGHFGRFYESIPLDINARSFGNETLDFYYFYYPSDGSLPGGANQGEFFYLYSLGAGIGVSGTLEPMYTEEVVAGFEYEVAPNVAVGLRYVTRELHDVIEDISVDGGNTYYIANPGGRVEVNPVTGEPLDEPIDFPRAVREYEAFELTLNKRFSDSWQLGASYVHAENVGNYGGLFRQENGQLDPNITSLFDLPELLAGAYGPLPNDQEHQVKLFGSYVWPFRLVTGFFAQYLSGAPMSKLGAHRWYGNNERFVTPRGSAGRMPEVWNVDLHLEYPIALRQGLDLRLIADVFNVTDNDAATRLNQTWTFARLLRTEDPNECGGPGTGPGTDCPEGNPLWGTPLEYQTPRTIRFGAKLSW